MQEVSLAELIPLVAGTIITLVLAYVPRVKSWWEGLNGEQKRLSLAVLYLSTAVGMYVPSCLAWYPVIECSTESIPDVIGAFILALIASQSAYTALPTRKKEQMSSAVSFAGDLPDA